MENIKIESNRTSINDFKPVKILAINIKSRTVKQFDSVSICATFFETNSQKISRHLKSKKPFSFKVDEYNIEYRR